MDSVESIKATILKGKPWQDLKNWKWSVISLTYSLLDKQLCEAKKLGIDNMVQTAAMQILTEEIDRRAEFIPGVILTKLGLDPYYVED